MIESAKYVRVSDGVGLSRLLVPELKSVLGSVGAKKSGNKSELLARCAEILRDDTRPSLAQKLREQIDLVAQRRPPPISIPRMNRPLNVGRVEQSQCLSRNTIAITERLVPEGPQEIQRHPENGAHEVLVAGRSFKKPRLEPECEHEVSSTTDNELSLVPDIMWPMAFMNVLKVLVEPQQVTSTRCSYAINFTSDDLVSISAQTRSVYFRCFKETGKAEETDLFPKGLSVVINGLPVPFSQAYIERSPMQYSKPINISRYINFGRESRNTLEVWTGSPGPEAGSVFKMAVYLCNARAWTEVLQGVVRNVKIPREDTISNIRAFLVDADPDVILHDKLVKVPVICPIRKATMKFPCRSVTCVHFTCFDAMNLLQLYSSAAGHRIKCPICQIRLKVQDLRIDEFTEDLLKQLKSTTDVSEVAIYQNGEGKWVAACSNN